jgi:hypothetical protein
MDKMSNFLLYSTIAMIWFCIIFYYYRTYQAYTICDPYPYETISRNIVVCEKTPGEYFIKKR